MASGDFNKKIQGIAKDLCFDPNAPMGPQLQNLSDGIRQMAFTIANELDPINTPTPPNLDLPPLDWQMPDLPDGFDGGMPSDGGWGGGGGGGGGDGGWGQDGEDGIGGEPGEDGIGRDGNDGQDGIDAEAGRGCIVPANTPTGITGMSGTTPGTGIAVLTRFTSQPDGAEKVLLNDAINDVVNDPNVLTDWGAVFAAHTSWELASKPDVADPPVFHANINTVIAYNISSQAVTAGKNILLGKDDEGKYWVLVESCGDDE